MANHPFLHRPFLLVPADPMQVDEPVEIGLQVLRLHAREPLDVAAYPGAQVVHELHLLEVDRVGGVGLVPLVDEPELLHEGVVGLLAVVDDRGALLDVLLERPVDPLRRGLAVLADGRQGPSPRVDGDDDADLVLREPSPAPLAGAPLDPRVGKVHLVDPDPAGEHHLLLPAADRREDLVPPEKRRRMADLAGQLDEAQRRVVAHHLDHLHDLVQRELRVGEDRAGKGAVPETAVRAPVAAAPGARDPVEPDALAAARGAPRRPPPFGEQALQGVRSVLLAAEPGCDRVPEFGKPLIGKAVDKGAQVERTAVHAPLRHLGSRPAGHLPRCRQTKKKMAFRAALLGGAIISRAGDGGLPVSPNS